MKKLGVSSNYFHIAKLASGLILLTCSQFSFAQEYTPFSVLGTSQALCKPGIESPEQLKAYFANNKETVEQVLHDAKWQGDAKDLFNAVAAGKFTSTTYAKGSKFEWTSLKKNGKGAANPYRIWDNNEAFEGFEVNFTSQCMNHQMVIPNACCNLSLVASSSVTPPAEPALSIESENNKVTICSEPGKEVTLTLASGSSKSVTMDDSGCWTDNLAAGTLMASATNSDQCGDAMAKVSHTVMASPFADFIPFVGFVVGGENRTRYEPMWKMKMEDGASLAGVIAGVMKPLSDTVTLFTQLGHLNGEGVSQRLLFPNNTLFWDIGADKRIGNAGFIGGGIGYWNMAEKSRYDDISLFLHGGSSFGSSNAQWFVEGRVFGEELDDIDSNNLISAGVRYLWK